MTERIEAQQLSLFLDDMKYVKNVKISSGYFFLKQYNDSKTEAYLWANDFSLVLITNNLLFYLCEDRLTISTFMYKGIELRLHKKSLIDKLLLLIFRRIFLKAQQLHVVCFGI